MEGFSVMAFASCRDRQQLTVHATIQISLTQPNNEVIPTQRPGIFFLFQFFFFMLTLWKVFQWQWVRKSTHLQIRVNSALPSVY